MTPYYVILSSVISLMFVSHYIRSDVFYYLAFLLLTFFAGLRVDVGVDFDSYDQMFSLIRMDDAPFSFEPLNILIINTVVNLGLGNQFIFIIYSLVIMTGVMVFIKKLSPSKELSLIIFMTIGIFYLSTLNGIRQWAAISMTLIAIVKLLDKKYFQTGFAVVAAVLFHFTAIILVLLPLLLFRWRLKYVVLSIIFCLFFADIFLYIIQNSQYFIYLDGLVFKQEGNPLFISGYLIFVVYSLVSLGYFSDSTQLSRTHVFLLNMNLASLFILSVGVVMKIDFLTLMRANSYFQLQLIVLIPVLLFKIKNIYFRSAGVYLCGLFCISYFLYTLLINGYNYQLVPYRMYWL